MCIRDRVKTVSKLAANSQKKKDEDKCEKNAFIINTEQFGEFARFYKLCKWTVSHKLDSGKPTLAALFNLY